MQPGGNGELDRLGKHVDKHTAETHVMLAAASISS